MLFEVIVISLLCSNHYNPASSNDVTRLIDTIESLQSELKDFTCEFEGTLVFTQAAKKKKNGLGEDGLKEAFSGTFVWQAGGNTLSDTLHREYPSKKLRRHTLVVRMNEGKAEEYNRLNDAPLGFSVTDDPKRVNSFQSGCFGKIFLIDLLKRLALDENLEANVRDEVLDGRSMSLLTFVPKSAPDTPLYKFWIDLHRNGHVVREESFFGKERGSYIDIELQQFQVGNTNFWMPTRGSSYSFGTIVGGKAVAVNDPTVIEVLYLVAGTLRVNQEPNQSVFRVNYKIGTPISDNLRKLKTEFGQQTIGNNPTKLDAEKMLKEQLKNAEDQKDSLVVASQDNGYSLWTWLAGFFVISTLISIVFLSIQRRP